MLIIPHASTVLMLSNLVRQERTLRLYANAAKPTLQSVRGDFMEVPTGSGYAPIVLVPTKWAIDPARPGETPMATYPKQVFRFTEGIGKVHGYFVTNAQGQLDWAEWFENGPYEIREPDDEIKVTPVFGFRQAGDVISASRTA